MKSDQKTADLCAALTSPQAYPVTTLKLRDCNLGDAAAQLIGKMLRCGSVRVTDLDLSMNVIKEEGALALAAGIAENQVLERLDLMGMPLLGKSERVLRGFVRMYASNTTLGKVVWRLDHPLANTLSQLVTRNNVLIQKRKDSNGGGSGGGSNPLLPSGQEQRLPPLSSPSLSPPPSSSSSSSSS
mmetsp:Transcript_63571/g.127702  ORF Transcript_63571/g.127702 Transcript_63571/m.127702 type:complete len:185 (+) Transcript_63571:400-954(+)